MSSMNKIYDTLYSRDTTGNIRVWSMEQSGNQYRTVSGLETGQLVTSDWSHADAKNVGKKNATTDVEQATAEIEAKYKKQLKTGYHLDVKDVDVFQYVEPMLAQTYHKLAKKNVPDYSKQKWGIQCKFNGNRCTATKNGLFTRTGEKYESVPHIEKSLESFFKQYPDAVLDGELFNNDLRQKLNEISELIRKTVHITSEDFATSEKLVRFHVYDGYNFDMGKAGFLFKESPYSERKQWIDNNVVGSYKYIEEVDTEEVKSEAHMKELLNKYLADLQEGAILRRMDSGYEHKRSKNLVKVKIDEDDEAEFLDITDGDGNWKGAATNITLRWKGKVFDGVFKGSYEQRVKILKEKDKWINRTGTFLYFGLTGLGTPNYARVDPDNCFKGH